MKLCATAVFAVMCSIGAANASNLIVNGGFEDGDLTGWNGDHPGAHAGYAFGDEYVPHSGTQLAYLGDFASEYPYGTLSQTFSDTAGQTLNVTYYLANDGNTPNYFDATWNGTLLTGSQISNGGSFAYTEYQFTVLSTGSDTLLFHEQNPVGYFSLDDVSVSVAGVPLPASAPLFGAALVAFGAVGYGLKRRKAAAAA